MATEVTIEIDDMHELMFEQMTEDEDVELEAWASDTLTTMIYQSYRQNE